MRVNSESLRPADYDGRLKHGVGRLCDRNQRLTYGNEVPSNHDNGLNINTLVSFCDCWLKSFGYLEGNVFKTSDLMIPW
uniref:Uncharacterized protein n=1 Tax=Ciona savignyi TaxID=51511 RepID=H2Y9F3_CIOSA